jgi:hypothetical protein
MCDGTLTRSAGYSNMDIIINERTRTPRYAANHSEVSMSIVVYYIDVRSTYQLGRKLWLTNQCFEILVCLRCRKWESKKKCTDRKRIHHI